MTTESRPVLGRSRKFELVTATVLAAWIIGSRLTGDIPNFQPVMAIALFGGFLFPKAWLALAVVAAGMAVSDAALGFAHWPIVAAVWLSLMVPVVAGVQLRRKRNSGMRCIVAVAAAPVWSALLFWLVTNAAVWAFAGWYPRTGAGLALCLSAGLPFLKWTLLGNVLYTGILFGGYGIATAIAGATGFSAPPCRRVSGVSVAVRPNV